MADERVRAIRDDDPLALWPKDKPLPVRLVDYEAVVGAGAIVSSLGNWGYFEGALLTCGLQRSQEEGLRIEGSAVMIAPGLAITATHVFEEYWDDLASGQERMALQGIRSDGSMDVWRVEHITISRVDDMALLSVALMSAIHPDWYISTFPLTTRTPTEGELITIVGFREAKEERVIELCEVSSQTSVGDVYVAQGTVGTVYPDGRDAVALPYPAFEVLCGSLGSMSGGAVLEASGKLVGIISRGWMTDAMDGPTYATVINELLTRPIRLDWPPGVYDARPMLYEIDPALVHIEGREKLIWKDGHLAYKVW